MANSVGDEDLQSNIRRKTAFSVVRQMSTLAEAINQQDRKDQAWSRTMIILVAAVVAIATVAIIVEPSLIQYFFRSLSGALR